MNTSADAADQVVRMSLNGAEFALKVIPNWVSSPERILYLIDTTNGESRLLHKMQTIDRFNYAFFDYNTPYAWGEKGIEGKYAVMTYAGFGSEYLKGAMTFRWWDYDYIICDELQNLLKYLSIDETASGKKAVDAQEDQTHKKDSRKYLKAANLALRQICAMGRTRIVALSATPRRIYRLFKELCHNVPYDRSDIHTLETFETIPYSRKVEELLSELRGKRGILYVDQIDSMKDYIATAQGLGYRANGFWRKREDKPMDEE